jgi:chromate transporter
MSEEIIKNKFSYKELIKGIIIVSLSAYGGPALMGVIKNKFVDEKKWIDESDFLESLSISQALPGAISVNLIAILGLKMKGFFGTFIFTFFFLLQAFCFITINAIIYTEYRNTDLFSNIFMGLGALVVALFLYATNSLAKPVFGKPSIKNIKGYLIALILFCLSYTKINIALLVLLSGLLGFLFYYFTNEIKEGNKISLNKTETKNNIFKSSALYFFLLYILVLVVIYLFSNPLWTLFYNFFKIGLLGFGGGYAVIPLIQDIVVDNLNLVTSIEFRDGIALSQLTPGPVFITTTYIGFKSAGFPGAIVATIASYSPSIFIILLLNKSIIKISHTKMFKAIIKGILCGFIGLIVGMLIHFGITSLINWQTWLIFAISVIILFLLKKEPYWAVILTILLSIILF